jgi:PAS domain-containing protein
MPRGNRTPRKKAAAAENGASGTKAARTAARTLAFARHIFEAAPVGLAAYDDTGQCVAVNEATAAVVGASVEQLLTQNFRKLESWKRSGLLAAAAGGWRKRTSPPASAARSGWTSASSLSAPTGTGTC